MRRLLLTTALILPFGAAGAIAQEVEEPETTAEDVGEAIGDAAGDTAQAIEEGVQEAGEAVEGAAEEVETEVEVETVEPEEVEVIEEGAEADAETAQADAAGGEQIVREQAQNELRVDWITGTTVTSPDGETIGNVNDLILDGETGELTAAILSVGGFLGIGAKQIAVDWDELQIDYDANEITMNLTREEAEAAPEYAFRDQEQPPAPVAPAGDTGMGAGGGMGAGDPAGGVEGAGGAD